MPSIFFFVLSDIRIEPDFEGYTCLNSGAGFEAFDSLGDTTLGLIRSGVRKGNLY